jgi:hypothetical protein
MALAVLCLVGACIVSVAAIAVETAPEYQVKAAFIVNFPKFVEWPPTRSLPPGAPLVLAVLGDDPFGPSLREAAAGKRAAGHPLEVRAVTSPREAAAAHVVFVSGSERGRLPALLKDLERAQVLTVGDSEGYGVAGVMVNLYLDDRRVRFEVNQQAVTRSGLKLSAQMLGVARLVGGAP